MHVHYAMQTETRELYPTWIDQIDPKKHNAGFTADMDGLLCAAFAKYHLGLEVNKFYDFRGLYSADISNQRETIFFDCAIKKGKTFDNHMTRLSQNSYVNPESANINNVTGVNLSNYTDKFAMSTLIQLYAIYNVPLPKSLQGKLILLCCDVGFKGFYDDRYKTTFLSYLERFNMLELVDVLNQFTRSQMYEIMLRAQMNISIKRQGSGRLCIDMDSRNLYGAKYMNFTTGMDLDIFTKHLGYPVELPEEQFTLVEAFKTKTIDTWELPKYMDMAHSYAFINSNKVMISLKRGA